MGHSFYYRSFKGLGSNRNWSQTWPCYSETVPEQHGDVTPRQSSWVWLFSSWNTVGPRGKVTNTVLLQTPQGLKEEKIPATGARTHTACAVAQGVTWFCIVQYASSCSQLLENRQGTLCLSEQLWKTKELISSHPPSESCMSLEPS